MIILACQIFFIRKRLNRCAIATHFPLIGSFIILVSDPLVKIYLQLLDALVGEVYASILADLPSTAVG
ncbi:hypothetical protein PUP50_09205 [Pseudomonas chlororaphis]|nr:hypothetical protein [Pseudomonas chlororaphis]WDH24436.1 hypothetical protein PUP50_09205 [Pseudomonas chlororaphis]